MPVIVVGGDTDQGSAILSALYSPERDVRAFVSDIDRGRQLKARGFKVAIGDVSDESHVEAASLGCFTAVLIAEAASDARERSFAADGAEVLRGWADAMDAAQPSRVIWVSDEPVPPTTATAVVVPSALRDLVSRVIELDEAQTIGNDP